MTARPERYFIGPSLKQKLHDVVAAVDNTPLGGGDAEVPVRLQSLMRGGGGKPLILGKTTAAWAKNTLATIQVYRGVPPPNESLTNEPGQSNYLENCVNKIEPIDAGRWVLVAKATNGSYYLVYGEPTVHELEVVTGVTLSGTGLVITKKKIYTYITPTDVAPFTIPTTDCPSYAT